MKLPGTLRNPGSDLARLPVGFDLRRVNVADGVLAAIACGSVVLLNEWLAWPPLLYAAIGANMACFCDNGGPIRRRAPVLLCFCVLGALCWAGFGMLRPFGLWVAVPAACLLVFCNSFARVWGLAALTVGNVLTVVMVFALDEPLSPHAALLVVVTFVGGGLWALLLVAVMCRLRPYGPQRAAVAEVWRMLAVLAADLLVLARRPEATPAEWEAHARAHRRAVRDALEAARDVVLVVARGRGQVSARAAEGVLRLEVADQVFGLLIALSEILEPASGPVRMAGARLLRRLAPLLLVLGRSMGGGRPLGRERLERTVAACAAAVEAEPALGDLGRALAERLRVAAKLSVPGSYQPDGSLTGEPRLDWRARVMGPLRANLSWESAGLRHAVRTVAMAAPALVLTLTWEGTYTHWLTYTVTLTMQPFFGATWQRALERIGGTVAGCLVGGALALLAHTPLQLAALMIPLCVVGFSARQVSYGAFIACLTPQIVVLVELVEPGHSSWEIAGMRALFTVAGGLIAVAGCLLLWPSWEPGRLREELGRALRAHADYAAALLGAAGGAPDPALERARRQAGLSSNNLEASISRAMQEPLRDKGARVEAAMVVDAALRRFAGRLLAVQHDGTGWRALDPAIRARWATWLPEALGALAERRTLPPRPEGAGPEALTRMARQVEVVEGALRRAWA